MTEPLLVKLAVVLLTAAFSLGGALRLHLTHISWPDERISRSLGALASLSVAAACWQLVGQRMPEYLYPLVLALLLLGLWQVVDAVRAIARITKRRITVMQRLKGRTHDHDHP